MLNQQDPNGCNINEGEKGSAEFIVSSEYPSEPLEFLEETFNQTTFFVGVIINGPRLSIIAFGRDGKLAS